MSGRMAMNNPWDIARIDTELYNDPNPISMTREEILRVSNQSISKNYNDF